MPGTWIQTVSGRKFDFLVPDVDSVHPFDVAWALAGINRFTGHTSPYYSVAQHCVRVSHMVQKQFALEGLLHDAAEAYIGDISTPLKAALNAISTNKFSSFEHNIEDVVSKALGVNPPMPPEVKRFDRIDFAIARRDLMGASERDYVGMGIKITPLPKLITMKPAEAFNAFVWRWIELDPTKKDILLDAIRFLQPRSSALYRLRNNKES